MSENDLCQEFREAWNDSRNKGLLTNGTIETRDGEKFKVHLELLASVSPCIRQMVNSFQVTPFSRLENVLMPSIDADDMRAIIRYVYTGKLAIPPEKVESLVLSAGTLEMEKVGSACVKYLVGKLNEGNCIDFYNFAKEYSCKQLLLACKKFMFTNFERVFTRSRNFFTLPADDLEMLLRSDELNVSNEEVVFWAIIAWMESNPTERLQYMSRLLACVRFGFCNVTFYQRNVVSHRFVKGNQDCQPVLYQASMLYTELAAARDERIPIDIHHPLIRPRIPHELIFAIGGWSNGSSSNVIESYDSRAQRWFPSIHTDIMPRSYHGLAVVDNLIYMVGGFDGHQCFGNMRCYNPQTRIWSERACMYYSRCYVSVATLNGFIYALGGYDSHNRLNSAERYDPASNQWHVITAMNHIRSDANAATLNGKIYIAGGFNGQQVLNSVEMYDPSSDTWTLLPEMSSPRSGVSVCALGDRLYVIGGFNGANRLSSMEYYDVFTRQWREAPSMMIPRSNFAAVVSEGSLYVIGGFNGMATVPNVERFVFAASEWEPVPEMNINRSALAACVVRGLPNSNEYSFLGSAAELAV